VEVRARKRTKPIRHAEFVRRRDQKCAELRAELAGDAGVEFDEANRRGPIPDSEEATTPELPWWNKT
jgi:hypothetical protein